MEAMKNFWDKCPTEILIKIFNNLDKKSLKDSMTVNRRWYAIIQNIITRQDDGWYDMVNKSFPDKGATFRKRSRLKCEEIIANSCIWHNINVAQPVHRFTFKTSDILNIHIYKNNIIIVCPSQVFYYSTEDYSLFRKITVECLDYDENDFIVSMLTKYNNFKVLHLRGKNFERTFQSKIDRVEAYKVVEKKCYVGLTDGSFYIQAWWNNSWHSFSSARYYGHGKISDITIHNNEVYIVLDWGGVMQIRQFGYTVKHSQLDIPNFGPSCPIVFNKSIAVIAGKPEKQCKDENVHLVNPLRLLASPHMTCVLQHGEVLLVGHANGRIDIYVPWTNAVDSEPNLTLNVRDFAGEELDDPAVRSIEVAESKLTHYLYVATHCYIYKIALVYPDVLKNYFAIFES